MVLTLFLMIAAVVLLVVVPVVLLARGLRVVESRLQRRSTERTTPSVEASRGPST